MPTELEVLRARAQEADQRAMSAEAEVRRLRRALAGSEAEVNALRSQLDRTRVSEANCFGRIIDRGKVLDIKQLIRECNADHRAEVARLLARVRQAKEAQSNLEALVSQQSALISHLRTTYSRSSRA